MSSAPKNISMCSIEISDTGIAAVYSANIISQQITAYEFYPFLSDKHNNDTNYIKTCLTTFVTKYRLKKTALVLVLHPSQYRVLLINTPKVPKAEYANAVKWQTKDATHCSVEDLVVDVFYDDNNNSIPEKIYSITAQRSFLQTTINIIQECYLQPIAIDIREFSARNLVTNLDEISTPSGFLDLSEHGCLLIIIQLDCVRFVRYIPIGLKKSSIDNCKELSMELRRSFDYCYTELKQTIPSKFFIPPTTNNLSIEIAQQIAQNLNKEISVLDLQQFLSFATPMNLAIQEHYWSAIGGILRATTKH